MHFVLDIQKFIKSSLWFDAMLPAIALALVWMWTVDWDGRMTVEDYAFAVCDHDDGFSELRTYGGLADALRNDVNIYEQLKPPKELRELHDAELAYKKWLWKP